VFPLALEAKGLARCQGGQLPKSRYEEQLPPIISLKEFHWRLEQNEEETWARVKNGFDNFHRQVDCQDLVLA